jgi:hypothetical protein
MMVCGLGVGVLRWGAAGKVGQLEAALMSRAEIDQAKGMLMAMHNITADEAFSRRWWRSRSGPAASCTVSPRH